MRRNIFLIQSIFVILTVAQQQSTDVLTSWPFYSSPAPIRNGSLLPACSLQGSSVNQRDDYTYVAGIGSYKLHTRAAPWNEARMTCEDEGGHLAIINSVAEANAMSEVFKDAEAITGSTLPDIAHIGFHDLYQEGQYITIHGQSLAKAGYTQFSHGQPNDFLGIEDCGSMHKNGGLGDICCPLPLGFICEIPID